MFGAGTSLPHQAHTALAVEGVYDTFAQRWVVADDHYPDEWIGSLCTVLTAGLTLRARRSAARRILSPTRRGSKVEHKIRGGVILRTVLVHCLFGMLRDPCARRGTPPLRGSRQGLGCQ